ncbi:unnamed protein product [Tilletia controversa]|nr:unnamed protein product [Tilletia controversa]CAD6970959.1 unnamed protein product [Tilletia controversa]CAD6979665.1 unnamed protein product [Tilletia controversa]
MSMVTVSAPSSNSPHPTSAYAIVHQVQDKRCALCSTPLGDVGFYRCESKDWTCPSCVAKDSAQIRFWERMKPYHWLASYYPSPVVYKKLLFRNVAVLFQACKFNTPQRFMEVARETSAERAFNKAKSLEKEVRSDWPAIKMQVMTFCQYLKFSQNKNLGLWLFIFLYFRFELHSPPYRLSIVTTKFLNDSTPKNKHWTWYAVLVSLPKVNFIVKQLIYLLHYDLRVRKSVLTVHLGPFLASDRHEVRFVRHMFVKGINGGRSEEVLLPLGIRTSRHFAQRPALEQHSDHPQAHLSPVITSIRWPAVELQLLRESAVATGIGLNQ